MNTIRELLEFKGQGPVHTIAPEAMVFEAISRMADMNIGAMLVVENNVIKGILTERDYLSKVAVKGRSSRETPVSELMTRKVVYVTPESSLEEVAAIMTEARIRHIPVLLEGRLLGIVSIGDVVRQISSNQQAHIRTLEEYINDSYPGPVARENLA